jgi:hypothetical protein
MEKQNHIWMHHLGTIELQLAGMFGSIYQGKLSGRRIEKKYVSS